VRQSQPRGSALGLGSRGPEEVELASEYLGSGGQDFTGLVGAIRQHIGLT